jgi:hypothetical protein
VHDGGRTVLIAAIIAFAATTEFASNRVARLPDELLECGDRLSAVGRDDSYRELNRLALAPARLNPQHYIADVLARIADHPARRIAELLPWNWQPLDATRAAA